MVTVCNKDDVDNGVCNNDELFDSDKNARQTFNPVEKNDYNNYPFSREAIDNTLNSQSLRIPLKPEFYHQGGWFYWFFRADWGGLGKNRPKHRPKPSSNQTQVSGKWRIV